MVSDAPCTIELAHRSERVVPALILGAWQQPPDTRVCAIYPLEPGAVVEEEVALGPFRRPTDADRERIARLAPITDRQWDILRLLMAGMTPAEIGEELYVSASTVRNHLSAMFRKFGVSTQHELLRLLSSLS
jgi:DNA-binding CsgD family transcriptional regulator